MKAQLIDKYTRYQKECWSYLEPGTSITLSCVSSFAVRACTIIVSRSALETNSSKYEWCKKTMQNELLAKNTRIIVPAIQKVLNIPVHERFQTFCHAESGTALPHRRFQTSCLLKGQEPPCHMNMPAIHNVWTSQSYKESMNILATNTKSFKHICHTNSL